jgi:putative glutamine amidotransferase
MHHQGIKSLGRGLVPAAVAPDGVIEAAESENGHFFVGVQWHPEALTEADPRMRQLFRAFVSAAAEYRDRTGAGLGSGV